MCGAISLAFRSGGRSVVRPPSNWVASCASWGWPRNRNASRYVGCCNPRSRSLSACWSPSAATPLHVHTFQVRGTDDGVPAKSHSHSLSVTERGTCESTCTEPPRPDSGPRDSGPDAPAVDSGPVDSGTEDAGETDAAMDDAGGEDAGVEEDAGGGEDAGGAEDAGSAEDAGAAEDAG